MAESTKASTSATQTEHQIPSIPTRGATKITLCFVFTNHRIDYRKIFTNFESGKQNKLTNNTMHSFIAILAITLGSLISDTAVPSESQLAGDWHCSGCRIVDYSGNSVDSIQDPDKSLVDYHIKGMGATEDNCFLSFSQRHKCKFSLGEKAFNLNWSIDDNSREFKASVGPFSIKGYLILEGGTLVLVYSRRNLFMMMLYLCTPEGRRHIKPLGTLLDQKDGLTVAIEFSK